MKGRVEAARRRLGRAADPTARTQALDRRLVELEQRVCTARLGRLVAACFRDRIPNHGHRIRTAPPSVSPQAKASILLHLYERREIALLRRHLRPELDVIEVGASLGVTGAVVAARLRAGRQLVAVEANPELVPELRRNLRSAARHDRAAGVHAALAYGPALHTSGVDTSGVDGSALDGSGVDGSGADRVAFVAGADSVLGSVATDPAAGEPVEAVTLGALRETWGLGRYALICDIEGGEWELIDQPAGVFSGCEQLFIELHDREGEEGTQRLLRRLVDVHGFVPVERLGPVHYLALRGTQAGHEPSLGPRIAGLGALAALGLAALGAWRHRRRPR